MSIALSSRGELGGAVLEDHYLGQFYFRNLLSLFAEKVKEAPE
jgi:hypothetical protein